jgi:hypothetical protein
MYTDMAGLESREYSRLNPLRLPRNTLCRQQLALTSPTCGGRSVTVVRSRTKATEFYTGMCYDNLILYQRIH